jgi:hypothetical protein
MSRKEKTTIAKRKWDAADYPYETDYNDHFETPLQAYADIQPFLDWCCAKSSGDGHDALSSNQPQKAAPAPLAKASGSMVLYDPYYCNGRTAVLLKKLGYNNVVHEKRDFYADICNETVPDHDVLVTNPPYSDTHKERCLDFCFGQLRGDREQFRPFLLLMPAYTAAKQYYRDCLISRANTCTTTNDDTLPVCNGEDVVYLVPSTPYHYDHPDHTGKDTSPFESLWFCGIGKERVQSLQQFWTRLPPSNVPRPTLVTSMAGLAAKNVISLQNRPNPRQRKKKRKEPVPPQQTLEFDPTTTNEQRNEALDARKRKASATQTPALVQKPTDKKSKYRDPSSGKRTKKRF